MIYISIGSNLGNRLSNLQNALTLLKQNGFHLSKQSPVIETEALLLDNALPDWNRPYYNMVVSGTSHLSTETLLHTLKKIEQQLGRDPTSARWSPRIIDLDILMSGDQILHTESCTLPHPELLNRPFLVHLLALIAPELRHPKTNQTFSEIAYHLQGMAQCYLRSLVASPKLVGIVNVTPNSFSDGGQFLTCERAVQQVLTLHEQGASVIDIGAQATSPHALMLTPTEEYERLKPILDALTPLIQEKNLCISIDSFSDETILTCLKHYPIRWINDVKGTLSDSCLESVAAQGCQFVATHSVSIPPNQSQIIPLGISSIDTILTWAEQTVTHLMHCGFNQENIILDPGIGFGKTPYQNIALLKDIAQLKSLGCPILIGHSRKLFMNLFNHLAPAERDIETIAVSRYLAKQGVDYLRVHNVLDHQRFFVADVF